ncbi:MAG TPA: hypothetical protein VK796_00240, partial [Cytophaga sp.]|nr:hypothetical protein [Cytophaga sp.]
MKYFIQTVIAFIIGLFLALPLRAQTDWLLSETIERTNSWNAPFYKPYNNVTALFKNRADSNTYCFDCNLSSIIWNGIEANKIPVYVLDKKKVLMLQKSISVKKLIQSIVDKNTNVESISDLLHEAEISLYRKCTTSNPTYLGELQIEWLSLEIKHNNNSYMFYMRAKECLQYLETYPCVWVHPTNYHVQINYKTALTNRNYLIGETKYVAAKNLQVFNAPMQNITPDISMLLANDTHTSDGILAIKTDSFLIYIQAMCSASIVSPLNRGYNKVHLSQLLMHMYEKGKIKGYAYHEAGYFTPITSVELSDHFLVEIVNEDDYSAKR